MGKRGKKAAGQTLYVPEFSDKRPGPPKGMTLRAHRIWKVIVKSLPPTHFRQGDYPLLRAYCEAEALHFEASHKIKEEGAVIHNGRIIKANPWVAIQTQTAHTMSQLATKLRLCANARISPQSAAREKETIKSKRKGILFGDEK